MTHLLLPQLSRHTVYLLHTGLMDKYWFSILVAIRIWFDAIMLLINDRPQVVLGLVPRSCPWAQWVSLDIPLC